MTQDELRKVVLATLLFLDETTSALDEGMEHAMYATVRQAVPRCTIVSVGHRSSILEYHDHVLDLQGPERWRLLPAKEYQMELAFDKAQPAVVRG